MHPEIDESMDKITATKTPLHPEGVNSAVLKTTPELSRTSMWSRWGYRTLLLCFGSLEHHWWHITGEGRTKSKMESHSGFWPPLWVPEQQERESETGYPQYLSLQVSVSQAERRKAES